MAAAAVAALFPVFYSLIGDQSRDYIGRQLWFGFIAAYGLIVYVVSMSWTTIEHDFYCYGNITKPCLMECFEKHFSHPIVGMWYFFYFIFLALFFLMEFIIAQLRCKQNKAMLLESVADEVEESSLVGIQETIPHPGKFFHFLYWEQLLLLLYLFFFLLQGGSQGVFLSFLVYQHLPLVSQDVTSCRSSSRCLGPTLCLIQGTMEKRMSIYTLISLSTTIIFFCSVLFVYVIHHYLLKVSANTKSHPDKV